MADNVNNDLVVKYVLEISALCEAHDTETAHLEADKLLCELLRELGYAAVSEVFESLRKYYS